MKFTPLDDRLVLELIEEDRKVGVLYMPEGSTREKSKRGVVVKVGPKVREVGVGDTVVVTLSAGVPFKADKAYLLVRENEVLARATP